MTISACCNRYEEAMADIDNAITDAIVKVSEDIVIMQMERLYRGLNADGSYIVPDYKPYTIIIKAKKRQPIDRVTLKDTGAFYDGIFVERRNETIFIDSADSKSEGLQAKYGEKIFGLRDGEKDFLKEQTTDIIVCYIKERVGL